MEKKTVQLSEYYVKKSEIDDLKEIKIDAFKGSLLNVIYPIGSIYLDVNDSDECPIASALGGEWERIKDRFLLASGDTYTAGDVDGNADAVLVSHSHNASSGYRFMLSKQGLEGGDMGTQSGTGRHYPYQTTRPDKSYWGSSTSTTTSGESGTGKNMPPYLVVSVWKRVQ